MKLPKHEIPERADWRALRDAAGGEKGLVRKVSIGKRLDEFEKAYRKARSPREVEALAAVVAELLTDVEYYKRKVARSHEDLADAVDEQLLQPVADFGERLANLDQDRERARNEAIDGLRSKLTALTETASQVRDEGQTLLEELAADLSRIVQLEAGGLDDLPDVRRMEQDRIIERHGSTERLARDNIGILEQLGRDVRDLVTEYRGEHSEAVDALEAEKFTAQIPISEVNDRYLKPNRRPENASADVKQTEIKVKTSTLGRPLAEINVAKEIHETVINLLNIR